MAGIPLKMHIFLHVIFSIFFKMELILLGDAGITGM
jgi:hypothetical protein